MYSSISYLKIFKVSGVGVCMKTINGEDITQPQMFLKYYESRRPTIDNKVHIGVHILKMKLT